MRNLFAFLMVQLFVIMSFSAQLTTEEKLSDFHQLIGRIRSNYGPIHYKKEFLNIDIDQLEKIYTEKIQSSTTNYQFYYLIGQFVAEFKDSHFAASLPTEKRTYLPFTVDLVQGKVLVEKINEEADPEKIQLKKGDEIVAIDGVPVQLLIEQIKSYLGEGFDGTLNRYATWLLTSRRASRVPAMVGTAQITIKPFDKSEAKTIALQWESKGEDDPETVQQIIEKATRFKTAGSFLKKASLFEKVESLMGPRSVKTQKFERSFMCSGETRIEKPEGAIVISEEPFVSYYWPTEKGFLGYLRIPHYYPEGDDEAKVLKTYMSQYEKAVSLLQKNTVGLIIDQDHNCGGYVSLVESMVGLFMDKPYRPMYFKLVSNKENYLEYKKYLSETDQLSLDYDRIQAVTEVVKKSWLAGDFMTPFVSLDGHDWLYPGPVRYTKPIIVLIDEMSGSGGDGFPALMQGFGRAKLLGTRTMGAGGHVTENAALNYSQITVNMTRSLFFRPDGVPVENNGAVPDIPYTMTAEDFTNGYKNYREFYTQKLINLIEQSR